MKCIITYRSQYRQYSHCQYQDRRMKHLRQFVFHNNNIALIINLCLSAYWQWILVNGHIGISAVIVKKCITTKSNTPALQYHVHIIVHWSGELSINPAFTGLAKQIYPISRSVHTTFAFYGKLLFLKTLFSSFLLLLAATTHPSWWIFPFLCVLRFLIKPQVVW